MATSNKNSSSGLPEINKKLAYRTLALVVIVGSLVYGMEWFLKHQQDLGGLQKTDTAGWISAIQLVPNGQGQRAVLISPDGQIHQDPGYVANTTDRDLAWSPHGNFLYFISDRVDHSFNVFRWAPGGGQPEQRTLGTRARGDLIFPNEQVDEPDSEARGLLTTGGIVEEFDPSDTSTAQVLPPTQKEITETHGDSEEGGNMEGQFEGVYGSLGTSFREAHWCGKRKFIVAIMRREAGEVLVVQGMIPTQGHLPSPQPIMAGDHLDVAVNPTTGDLIYCVEGFQWIQGTPPVGKNGKPGVKPFVNGLAVYGFDGTNLVLGRSNGDLTFRSPSISPDGKVVAVIVGGVKAGNETTQGLMTAPTTANPNFKPAQFVGDIHEPSWSADGTHIVAVLRLPGKPRAIFEFSFDGTQPRNLTGDTGDYEFPKYSPQIRTN